MDVSVVYDQCSNKMKVKLNGMSEYKQSKKDNDVIALLAMILGYKGTAVNLTYLMTST